MEKVNLTHHFLIAMPGMADPHFSKTLTYICDHNDQGALGLVVNRPIDMTLQALFDEISVPYFSKELQDLPIYFGGPVQAGQGFVLHQPIGHWQSTLAIGNEVGLTTSIDILQAVANGEGPTRMLITLGYAGWAPGQIEYELSQNAWLTVDATADVLFDLAPEERLAAAMQRLGVNLANLSGAVGHA